MGKFQGRWGRSDAAEVVSLFLALCQRGKEQGAGARTRAFEAWCHRPAGPLGSEAWRTLPRTFLLLEHPDSPIPPERPPSVVPSVAAHHFLARSLSGSAEWTRSASRSTHEAGERLGSAVPLL